MQGVDKSLPQGWSWTTLGSVAQYVNGRAFKPSEWEENGRPIIRIQNLTGSTNVVNRYSGEVEEKHVIRGGDLLISWSATLGVFIYRGEEAVLNQHIFRVTPYIDKMFLFYLVSAFIDDLKRQVHGSGMQHITKGKFERSSVPLAPLPEQHRIVAEIETQFTRLDAGIAALKRAQVNLRRYKASVLKAACEGRLVPTEAELACQEGRDYEPADVLLQRILAERQARWKAENPKKKYKEPAAPNADDLPESPEGWVWATSEQLSDETRSITYGVVKLGSPVDGGVPTLRSSNVRSLRIEDENIKRISPKISNNYRRTVLQGGEVLVTVRGTLGGVAIVPEHYSGFNISREVAMIALVDPTVGPVLQFFIASNPTQRWLLARTRGIAYMGINIATLKQTPLPLPPIAEQHCIVAEVERRLSVVQEMEATVEANLKRAERLRQAILKRAFEGKLVPQDPNDESASVFLQRIQAENGGREAERKADKGHQNRKRSRQLELFYEPSQEVIQSAKA